MPQKGGFKNRKLVLKDTVKSRKNKESRPISRVLSWTVIHLGYTSPYTSSNLPGSCTGHASLPYLVLLQAGFTLPPVLPPARCALTAPFHPYRYLSVLRRYIFCGTFRRLSPPRRYLAPCPVEPGLSSAPDGHSDCLADSPPVIIMQKPIQLFGFLSLFSIRP